MSAVSHIDVVGLGPAGPELITVDCRRMLDAADTLVLRTARHPSATEFVDRALACDHLYQSETTFEAVYRGVVRYVLDQAAPGRQTVYAVPGSPMVAERTVALLLDAPEVLSGEVTVTVHPSLSFLDVAYVRLACDPLDAGVRLVDGESFAADAAGQRGPLLVAQCWSQGILSNIKLAVDPAPTAPVIVLHHLGLPDERVWQLDWHELDRSFEPDHLTSLWIPELAAPIGRELIRLDELVRTLRQQCPWDKEQTHGSLARHLLEESYEVLEALDAITTVDNRTTAPSGAVEDSQRHEAEEHAVAHLEEELGDLLFQVYFHAALAAEVGRFTMADVAQGIYDKLVYRHPHVFGDVSVTTPDEVASNWEALKKQEKGRSSVTEGIPMALPALALAAKLQRKGIAVGLTLPDINEEARAVAERLEALIDDQSITRGDLDQLSTVSVADGEGGPGEIAAAIGDLLFRLVSVARQMGVDPENALRVRSAVFRSTVEELG